MARRRRPPDDPAAPRPQKPDPGHPDSRALGAMAEAVRRARQAGPVGDPETPSAKLPVRPPPPPVRGRSAPAPDSQAPAAEVLEARPEPTGPGTPASPDDPRPGPPPDPPGRLPADRGPLPTDPTAEALIPPPDGRHGVRPATAGRPTAIPPDPQPTMAVQPDVRATSPTGFAPPRAAQPSATVALPVVPGIVGGSVRPNPAGRASDDSVSACSEHPHRSGSRSLRRRGRQRPIGPPSADRRPAGRHPAPGLPTRHHRLSAGEASGS